MLGSVLSVLLLPLAALAAPSCKFGGCSVSNDQLYLPAQVMPNITIPQNLSAIYFAVGEGYQNYTCATSDSTSKPVAIGAVANLYDASCKSDKFANLTANKYGQELANGVEATQIATMLGYLGQHYFQETIANTSAPTFDFRTGALQNDPNGFVITKKVGAANTPWGDPTVDVQWLELVKDNTTDGAGDLALTVIRAYTAGGQPNATCAGSPPAFQVPYSAIYAFFSSQ